MKKLLLCIVVLLFILQLCPMNHVSSYISSHIANITPSTEHIISQITKYALGKGFNAFAPFLKQTEFVGGKIQQIGLFSRVMSGLAILGSSAFIIATFIQYNKRNKETLENLEKIMQKIEELSKKIAKPSPITPAITAESVIDIIEINKKLKRLNTEKSAIEAQLAKQKSLLHKLAIPVILTLGTTSLYANAYGFGYTGDWLNWGGASLLKLRK